MISFRNYLHELSADYLRKRSIDSLFFFKIQTVRLYTPKFCSREPTQEFPRKKLLAQSFLKIMDTYYLN